MGDRPSQFFLRYIRKYPDSRIAKDFKDYGSVQGHFAEALFMGDLDGIASRADEKNRVLLANMGFKPEWWG